MQQSVLIDGRWRPADSPVGAFRAEDPTTGRACGEEYPVSGWRDIAAALEAGKRAAQALHTRSPEKLADFLESLAGSIEQNRSELATMASLETALPQEPRLCSIELPRTCGQLRQAAAAARDRSWCLAVIDTALNIRSRYGPLDGPVAILGPNNFPLAFNPLSGGDFAAAVAVGNPVIAKAHPGHPGTSRLLAELVLAALQSSGLPLSQVQLIYEMRPEDGLRLVSHPDIGATAFTGSRRAGLQLKRAADTAGKPIYLEMSGINPVILLPGALNERGSEIAAELGTSCTLGAGQFCTNPGLVILQQDAAGERFLQELGRNLDELPDGILLGRQVREGWSEALGILETHGAERLTRRTVPQTRGIPAMNTLLKISGDEFLKNSATAQIEAFGPSTLTVLVRDQAQMEAVIKNLEGNLTGSIYSHSQEKDDAAYARIEPLLRSRVGRLLNDKMPTGVAVSPAMHHGGPFPATGHPGFSAVGIPRSLLRFTALQCYDHVRENRLPPELRDRNPTGEMWRLIDGAWTQSDAESSCDRDREGREKAQE
ncbi:MAG: aldehyde dehydrogenase family protein [Candidatus Aminicenantaceae bacterium]